MDLNSFFEKMGEFLQWVFITVLCIVLICALYGAFTGNEEIVNIGLMIVIFSFFFVIGLGVVMVVCPEFVFLVAFILYAIFWVCKGVFKGLFKAFVWLKNREDKSSLKEEREESSEYKSSLKERMEKLSNQNSPKNSAGETTFTFERAMQEIDVTRANVLIPFWVIFWGFVSAIAFLCFGMIPSAIFSGICMICGALRLFFVINAHKKTKINTD